MHRSRLTPDDEGLAATAQKESTALEFMGILYLQPTTAAGVA